MGGVVATGGAGPAGVEVGTGGRVDVGAGLVAVGAAFVEVGSGSGAVEAGEVAVGTGRVAVGATAVAPKTVASLPGSSPLPASMRTTRITIMPPAAKPINPRCRGFRVICTA